MKSKRKWNGPFFVDKALFRETGKRCIMQKIGTIFYTFEYEYKSAASINAFIWRMNRDWVIVTSQFRVRMQEAA